MDKYSLGHDPWEVRRERRKKLLPIFVIKIRNRHEKAWHETIIAYMTHSSIENWFMASNTII